MKLLTAFVAAASLASSHIPKDYARWSHVAVCESGGWRVLGSSYPDSLGITRANYVAFGGKPLPIGRVSLKNRIAQIRVADRLIKKYHAVIPDPGTSCAAW